MKITAIILTLNEEIHLARCIESIQPIADQIVVVDAYSVDSTIAIARKYNCEVLQNKWVNHGQQFNWALSQIGSDSGWILRIDADEYIDSRLRLAIKRFKNRDIGLLTGVYFKRAIRFQGKLIRFGGVGSVGVVRLFKYGSGRSELRWMDEHIIVDGKVAKLPGSLIDDNLNTLSFWVAKHNRYADKEAFEQLILRYSNTEINKQMQRQKSPRLNRGSENKRWIKNNIYKHFPVGIRAGLYFFYRYLFCFGFLDGPKGFAFHFLQGFWYRYLVDLKFQEAVKYIESQKVSYLFAAKKILKIEFGP
jgi:glycosyltransferase involved in cell wall biosynthesis